MQILAIENAVWYLASAAMDSGVMRVRQRLNKAYSFLCVLQRDVKDEQEYF